MKLTRQDAAGTILLEMVRRMVQHRIGLGLTQQDVANQTGVSLGTIKRIEMGYDCQFSTMVRLLQAYDLVDRLDALVPEPSVSPIQFIEQQQKPRKRALKKVAPSKSWKWGDES